MSGSWSQISVCVITLNEEENLRACLESVEGCGERIVIDSGSEDNTLQIAKEFGAHFKIKPWKGFAEQRREAEALANKLFVLFLDADERVSPELHHEIAMLLEKAGADERLYFFQRKSEFLGKTIRHGDWKGDWVARLAPLGKTHWVGREPHPYLTSLTGEKLENYHCKNVLWHRPYRDIKVFSQKIESYAKTWAQEAYQVNERGGKVKGFLRAIWRWFRGYLLRGGFLDGYAGWIIAKQNARMVWLKYLFLSQLYRKSRS